MYLVMKAYFINILIKNTLDPKYMFDTNINLKISEKYTRGLI